MLFFFNMIPENLKSPKWLAGLPGSSTGKESSCNMGDLGLIPGLGRSPGGGHGNPFQYSCLENPHGQRSLVGLAGYSPWGWKELDTTERLGTAQHKWLFLLGCSGGCGAQATAAPDPDTCHLFPTASGWGCFPEKISLNCNAAPALFCIAVCTIEMRSSSTCPPSPNLTSSWWKILEMGEEGRAPGEPFWCLITWGGEVAAQG